MNNQFSQQSRHETILSQGNNNRVMSTHNVNNENPNNNNKKIKCSPLMYNQVIPNPQMNKQYYSSFFLPSYQYQGSNQKPFFRWRGLIFRQRDETFLLEMMTQKKYWWEYHENLCISKTYVLSSPVFHWFIWNQKNGRLSGRSDKIFSDIIGAIWEEKTLWAQKSKYRSI